MAKGYKGMPRGLSGEAVKFPVRLVTLARMQLRSMKPTASKARPR